MDIRHIETVLSDQKEELQHLMQQSFCRRAEEELIDLDSSMAQVVIGVRRSGKSTLCLNALKRSGVKFAYINFDDENLADIKAADLNPMLEVLYKIYGDFRHLFIDEIQNVDEWYLFVNRLLRRGMHVIITGSNAKLLSGELATHLTGRYMPIELYPFSFVEYCELNKVETTVRTTKATAFLRAAFDNYLHDGGFPELSKTRNHTTYIATLVESILERDIRQRFKMRYATAFFSMATHLLNIVPALVVTSSLSKLFGIKSDHTTENYIGYLKQAYLLVELRKFSPKSRLRVHDAKCYPIDIALMNKRPNAFAGENMGWRLECVVYIELLRRYGKEQKDIYYYLDQSNEVDFVVCQGNMPLEAYQVAFDIANPKTRQRELAGLNTAAKKLHCSELWLITDHDREEVTLPCGAVAHIVPAYEWLLEGNR